MSQFFFSPDHNPKIVDSLLIHVENSQAWSFPSHSHDSYTELTFLADGELEVQMNGDIYIMQPGDIIIKQPHQIHKERSIVKGPLTLICLIIEGVHFDGNSPNELLVDVNHTHLICKDRQNLLHELFSYIEHSHPTRTIPVEMINTILLLLRELETDGYFRSPRCSDKATLVDSIRNYIDENYEKKLSLQLLGDAFFLSPCYLERLFTKETGMNINRYIMERRMGEAERLLIFSSEEIKFIAARCGYPDVHYFYKVFKNYTGITPLEFRNKYGK